MANQLQTRWPDEVAARTQPAQTATAMVSFWRLINPGAFKRELRFQTAQAAQTTVVHWITNTSSPIGWLSFTFLTLYSAKYAPIWVSSRCENEDGISTPSTSMNFEFSVPNVTPLYGMMYCITRPLAGSIKKSVVLPSLSTIRKPRSFFLSGRADTV